LQVCSGFLCENTGDLVGVLTTPPGCLEEYGQETLDQLGAGVQELLVGGNRTWRPVVDPELGCHVTI
jgi:hypothetical protein